MGNLYKYFRKSKFKVRDWGRDNAALTKSCMTIKVQTKHG